MEISFPRTWHISLSESGTRSLPRNRMHPSSISAGGAGRSFRMDSAVTVFPHPDSPTSPSVSPGNRENETPNRARTFPFSVRKETVRSLTERRSELTAISSCAMEPGHDVFPTWCTPVGTLPGEAAPRGRPLARGGIPLRYARDLAPARCRFRSPEQGSRSTGRFVEPPASPRVPGTGRSSRRTGDAVCGGCRNVHSSLISPSAAGRRRPGSPRRGGSTRGR